MEVYHLLPSIYSIQTSEVCHDHKGSLVILDLFLVSTFMGQWTISFKLKKKCHQRHVIKRLVSIGSASDIPRAQACHPNRSRLPPLGVTPTQREWVEGHGCQYASRASAAALMTRFYMHISTHQNDQNMIVIIL